jgi:xylan 1,4-beta-xylosidase
MTGERAVVVNGGVDLSKKPIWIEAPHIFETNGWYYLICAEGGTAGQHSEVVFRAKSVRGPYVPYSGNPILTQRHLSPSRANPITAAGHADFVETSNGEWWAVFLGIRPYASGLSNIGRETFMLPVTWRDGWPGMLTGTETVPYVHTVPALPRSPSASPPLNGNFLVREEFNTHTLAPYWEMIRTPHDSWYDLTSSPGSLTLRARPVDIGAKGQPSFIGRRQQHAAASASVSMRYAPGRPGDAAGLVAFQSDSFYFFLGETLSQGKLVVRLVRRAGPKDGTGVTLAEAPLTSALGAPIQLRIDARGRQYDFYYGERANEWKPLARDVDGSILSTQVAGGFVGTMIGMYAFTLPK